jgi:dCTP diphosphatase
MDIHEFQEAVARMKAERDWHQFHQPKDLLLGLIEEIGEFRNIVKWEQDPDRIREMLVTGCPPDRRAEIVDFFGDALWYLGSLADYCGVDLREAMDANIRELEGRFPVEKVRGSTANSKTGGFDGKYKEE